MKKANQKGQAAIESAITILLIVAIYLSIIQIMHIAIIRIVAFDSAQASVRADIVGKNNKTSAIWVLQTQKIGNVILPTQISSSQNKNNIHIIKITYLQKIDRFLDFFSISGIAWLPGSSVCRMVAPPRTQFFNRAYPGAKTDD